MKGRSGGRDKGGSLHRVSVQLDCLHVTSRVSAQTTSQSQAMWVSCTWILAQLARENRMQCQMDQIFVLTDYAHIHTCRMSCQLRVPQSTGFMCIAGLSIAACCGEYSPRSLHACSLACNTINLTCFSIAFCFNCILLIFGGTSYIAFWLLQECQ